MANGLKAARRKRMWASLVYFLKTHRKGTAVAIGVALGLVLFFQNTHQVRTYVFFWSLKLPLIAWALFFAIIGYLVGKSIEWAYGRKLHRSTGTEDET
ncbi:MAG: hypothetical protein J7M25_01055 [Deltaproteobacteria bacterium]|nr:hypothetical protein [Deltaproteobacteria bacterium]